MSDTTITEVEKQKFHLDILNFTQTSQIQYGLRLQDYKKYRQYCTKRITRLRSQLRKEYGKKEYIKKIGGDAGKAVNDVRYLQIALLKTERAWSYAMDLKATFEKSQESRVGFHSNRRFAKASVNATQLYEVCKHVADTYTIIEAQAYASWMKSSLHILKKEFKQALEQTNIAKTIYEKLSVSGDHSQKELYLKRIEDTEPIIRFCNYNLKTTNATVQITPATMKLIEESLKEMIIEEKANATTTTGNATEIITWKSKSVKVDEKLDEKLRAYNQYKLENQSKLPTNIQTVDTSKDISGVFQVYDKLVYHLISCETIVKNNLSAIVRANLKSKSVKSEIEEQSCSVLLAYIMYHKMKYLYERNYILITMMQRVLDGEQVDESAIKKKLKKVTFNDLVRLSTHQVKVYSVMSESRDTDTNKDIARDQDAQLILLKSTRLYYIATCLAKGGKFSETMAILDRVLANISSVRKTNTKNQSILKDTTQLEESIKKQRSQIHANSFIQQLQFNEQAQQASADTTTTTTDMVSDIDSYDTKYLTEKKLIQLPPQLLPVPIKPLFFDLAFNNVSFPSLDQRKKGASSGSSSSNTSSTTTSSTSNSNTPSKGLFGFWGRG